MERTCTSCTSATSALSNRDGEEEQDLEWIQFSISKNVGKSENTVKEAVKMLRSLNSTRVGPRKKTSDDNSRAAVSAAGFPVQRQTGLGQRELVLRAQTQQNGAGIRRGEPGRGDGD